MLSFDYGDLSIPLSCVSGLSYKKSAHVIDKSNMSCESRGFDVIQAQLQIAANRASCVDSPFDDLVNRLSSLSPTTVGTPGGISVGGVALVPQMLFMISSVNYSAQSDKTGRIEELNVDVTFTGTRVVKEENRKTELATGNSGRFPSVEFHCDGKTISCSKDISISRLVLSDSFGSIELLLSDTYREISRTSWLKTPNDDSGSYFDIEGMGRYFVLSSSLQDECWLSFQVTKFPREFYRKRSQTYLERTRVSDLFPGVISHTGAAFSYFKFDDTPFNVLNVLRDALGFLVSSRGSDVVFYDVPDRIESGEITFDYLCERDSMTTPITKAIIRDGVGEFVAGTDDGETYYAKSPCLLSEDGEETARRVLKYVNFLKNVIILPVPYDARIAQGSVVNVKTGNEILACVVTQFEVDFIENLMRLELHYV